MAQIVISQILTAPVIAFHDTKQEEYETDFYHGGKKYRLKGEKISKLPLLILNALVQVLTGKKAKKSTVASPSFRSDFRSAVKSITEGGGSFYTKNYSDGGACAIWTVEEEKEEK